ncbi:hypothetical protein [Hyphomicrobium sp.]|uniref:hypothetical protein n=1 Tax=Hyphomicrobium sp. TaxID=82 RepID=UPI003561A384
MSKKQKKKFKRLDGRKAKLAFIEALRLQQLDIGLKANWERAYRRRCKKKGAACPLDRLDARADSHTPSLSPHPELLV